MENIWYAMFAVWAAREIYNSIKGDTKENTRATVANTYAIAKLEAKLDNVLAGIALLPKLREDINEAHAKIREDRARRKDVGNNGH